MLKKNHSKEEILDILIESVMTFNPSLFKQCLWSEHLEIISANKMMFYWYFKGMVNGAKSNSIGDLYLKLEKYDYNPEALFYNFYDKYHTNSRLTVEVIDKGDKIHIDVMPF
jgi:hypothetical protein